MKIDLVTLSVLNSIVSLLLSACLFSASRSHFREIKGIQHWSVALLLLGISSICLLLKGVIPHSFLMVVNSTCASIGVACYFYALVAFKELSVPKKWIYLVLAFGFIGNVYFVYFPFNLNAKIVVTSFTLAILLFASSAVLLTKQHGVCPFSHRLTRNIFACIATAVLVQAFYYGFWHTQPEPILLHTYGIESIFYLFTTITIVGTSFGFVLMCMEKYLDEKNRAQLAEHEALEQISKNEQQLQVLSVAIEQSPASILITDSNARLIYVNSKFTEVTGYCKEEVIGKNPRILRSGLTPETVYEHLWSTLRQGEVWRGELINHRKNGEIYWDESYITPVKNSVGITTHFVGIKLDITKRKNEEMEFHQAKEAAIAANQAKSEFLANMSHEIRTPLNAILGFSEILSNLITDKVHRYYLDAMNASGKTLLQIINDILDLSKIEAGKLDLNLTPVEIEPIFSDIGMVFMQKMSDKDLSFSIEIPEKMPTCLVLDEIRLRQILLNIVGNAVKFTDTGEIRISVNMQSCASPQFIDLSIAVEDSGMGIADDQITLIFSPFTQQKQQSVRYGGTGLGLSICKRLVEMMGGKISVSSTLDVGSCFTVELPDVEIFSQANSDTTIETILPPEINLPNSLKTFNCALPSVEYTDIVNPQQWQELVELLNSNYQAKMAEMNSSGVFEIDAFVDIAEQLLQIAEQYHCRLLADWADSLKNQAKLFDIINITKTLTAFEKLIAQLR